MGRGDKKKWKGLDQATNAEKEHNARESDMKAFEKKMKIAWKQLWDFKKRKIEEHK